MSDKRNNRAQDQRAAAADFRPPAGVEVRLARISDLADLAPRLRAADVEEIRAIANLEPYAALRASFMWSVPSWTGIVGGELVCMFGVTPHWPLARGVGQPWLLGSDAIERHAVAFLRCSRPCLRDMLKAFRRLENFIDARNRVSIRWLEWLGFTIHPAAPHGPFGLPFHRFTMEA